MSSFSKHLVVWLALAALAPAPVLAAGGYTISGPSSGSCSNVVFTITRSGSAIPETVRCRTIGITAYPTQHFAPVNTQLVFAVGESSKSIVVEEMNPVDPSYRFQTGNARTYRLQVTDMGSFILCDKTKAIVYGPDYDVPADLFAEKSLPVSSAAIYVTDGGFVQACHEVPLGDNFSSVAVRNYLEIANAELRMTLEMQAKEVGDGYQHVQILANRGTNEFDTIKGDEAGTPSRSLYMACFSHYEPELDETFASYSFPVTTAGDGGSASKPWSGNAVGDLRKQNFKSGCRASDGKLVLPSDLKTLHVRLDASGKDEDDWIASNVVAKIQATDTITPTVSSLYITVSPGVYARGNQVWVSVPFNEIVTVEGQPVIITTWGDFSYVSGSGSNVLTFNGTVDCNDAFHLVLSRFRDGAVIKDLAGNALSDLTLNCHFTDAVASSPYAYAIAYDLDGGTFTATAPTSFTCESSAITLVAPTRPGGYAFAGWTGSNGSTPQTSVTIPADSHCDRFYIANWVQTPWMQLQYQLEQGGTVTLTNSCAPRNIDKGELVITNAVKLDLNGHTLTGNGSNSVVWIVRGNLTLTNSVEGRGGITGGKPGVFMDGNSMFTMNGGTITGNSSSNLGGGGGVCVYGGTFTMNGGTISGNTAEDGGGVGVCNDAMFTMNGGTISGNTAVKGGGVVMRYSGMFTMTDGMISCNTAEDGGGVYIEGDMSWLSGGTFTMTGGTIFGNSASSNSGGGVFVALLGDFKMLGGEIVGNLARVGGGVFLQMGETRTFNYFQETYTQFYRPSAFLIGGGTIFGNTATGGGVGAGIYVEDNNSLNIDGNPVVYGNTNGLGTANNVYLEGGKTIAVSNLVAGASIGVTTANKPSGSGVVTLAIDAAAGDALYFFSDDLAYHVEERQGEVCLASGRVLPAYLDGADEEVKGNWMTWAARYGAKTNVDYEANFLLDIDPMTSIPAGADLLKIVDFRLTPSNMFVEVASDIAAFEEKGSGSPSVVGNGFLVLDGATDLSAVHGEWSPIAPVAPGFRNGHAVMNVPFGDGGGASLPPTLFIKAAITNSLPPALNQ